MTHCQHERPTRSANKQSWHQEPHFFCSLEHTRGRKSGATLHDGRVQRDRRQSSGTHPFGLNSLLRAETVGTEKLRRNRLVSERVMATAAACERIVAAHCGSALWQRNGISLNHVSNILRCLYGGTHPVSETTPQHRRSVCQRRTSLGPRRRADLFIRCDLREESGVSEK